MARLRIAAVCLLCAALLAEGGISCRAMDVLPVRRESREEARHRERMRRAEEAARRILGEHTPLTSAERGDLLLFTCRNGYALTNPADGSVVEYALSFPGRDPVFRREEPGTDNGGSPTK